MEFSCCLLPPTDPRGLVRMAQTAAELGYGRVWIPDQSLRCDPFVALSYLAREVDVALGLAITNPFSRHPVQIARSIATIYHMTGRRDWKFAIGASNPHHVLKPMGLRMRNSARQIGDSVSVIRRLVAGERVFYEDPRSDFVLDDVAIELDPVPAGEVKILVGTRGPQTIVEAGRHADGILVEGLFTPEGIAWAREKIAEGAGDRPMDTFDYTAWQVTEVVDEGAAIPEHAAAFARVLMSTTHPTVLRRLGFDDDLIALVKEPGDDVRPVPAWATQRLIAVGTPEVLRERVTAAASAGAQAWACSFTGDIDETVTSMTRFAQEVIADFRPPRHESSRTR